MIIVEESLLAIPISALFIFMLVAFMKLFSPALKALSPTLKILSESKVICDPETSTASFPIFVK
mgnify:CR=1 FL=1